MTSLRIIASSLASVLLAPPVATAATLPEMFSAGVAAFQAGRYDEAARDFRDLHERYGADSPDVLVNLGASEFAAGRPGAALVALHKARLSAPGGRVAATASVDLDRIRSALNERQGDRPAKGGFLFAPYHDAWTAMLGWAAPRVALVVFMSAWFVLFVLLGVWRLSAPGRRRSLMGGLAIGLAVVVGCSGLVLYGADRVSSYRVGVVMEGGAALYDDVAAVEPALTLPEALETRVVESRGGFVRVRLSSGRQGWVAERTLGIP